MDRFDFVSFYDGETKFDTALERLSGENSQYDDYQITASGSKILINLESDESETRQGFEIRFNAG